MIFILVTVLINTPRYPYSSTFLDKHRCAALPFCASWPHLYPLRLPGVEFHTGPLLVLQVQSPVGQALDITIRHLHLRHINSLIIQ